MQVDPDRKVQVRRVVGHHAYEIRRRELWAEVAKLNEEGDLGELALFCMGPCHFPHGCRRQLHLFEPRYREMMRRVMAPGGVRRFAIILDPAEFEAGARCRVCDIIDCAESPAGDWTLVIEGGEACRLISVTSEDVQAGLEPLYHGKLEEVDESELASLIQAAPQQTGMLEILNALGIHLQAMRNRRLMLPLVGLLNDAAEFERARDNVPEALASASQADELRRITETSLDGLNTMQNLLLAYRQLLTRMDQLIEEATNIPEDLRSDESASAGRPTQIHAESEPTQAAGFSVPRAEQWMRLRGVTDAGRPRSSTSEDNVPAPTFGETRRIPSRGRAHADEHSDEHPPPTPPTSSPLRTFGRVRQSLRATASNSSDAGEAQERDQRRTPARTTLVDMSAASTGGLRSSPSSALRAEEPQPPQGTRSAHPPSPANTRRRSFASPAAAARASSSSAADATSALSNASRLSTPNVARAPRAPSTPSRSHRGRSSHGAVFQRAARATLPSNQRRLLTE